MAYTGEIKIVNSFADDSTRDIKFGPFDSDAAVLNATTLKSRIAALNSDTSAIASYYLSDDGSSFTAITGATITVVEESEINLNS